MSHYLKRDSKTRSIKKQKTETKMKDHHNANDLTLLNRLLEQLHQADYRVLGSIEINIYVHGREERETHPGPPCVGRGNGSETQKQLPEALSTEAAMALWEKVREAGYVDENYQPLLSRSQSALLADEMAERLGIKEKWKVFETLWQRRNMYRDYHDALNQRQSLQFRDQLKGLFR